MRTFWQDLRYSLRLLLKSRLAAEGFQPAQAPHDEGFGPVASFHDPDGNLIEPVELRYEFKPAG